MYTRDLWLVNHLFHKELLYVVTLTAPSESYFKGFFFQARAPGSNSQVGAWTLLDSANQNFVNCNGPNSAVSHNSKSEKSTTVAAWTAPSNYDSSTVNIMYDCTVFRCIIVDLNVFCKYVLVSPYNNK